MRSESTTSKPNSQAISENFEDHQSGVRELTKPTGIAIEPKFDYLIVSPETRDGGEMINGIRAENALEPLNIEVVDHVRGEDGGIISSTRIVKCEIDEHGNLTPDSDTQ